ncbi:MAG: PmoA family protein [Candidatus Sumerlaeota bacterium]|nr:PmoA family protein [Candidatus Sumerlaeota bacterium]
MNRFCLFIPGVLCLALAGPAHGLTPPPNGVVFTDLGDRVAVAVDNTSFADYYYKDVPRPFLYPIVAPTGDSIVRNYPMKTDVPGEPTDHVHHRSLWYGHGSVNGVDFWGETSKSGKIVHDKFTRMESGMNVGTLEAVNKWVAPDGKVVCEDTRTIRFYAADPTVRVLDFDIRLQATNGPVTFGDTKEGTMAIRLAPPLQLKGKGAQGHCLTSEGVRDKDAWGKRAAWVDYYGPVNDKVVGVAIFDHPANPRHPTWWHARDYGLFAANPFGIHDFEKKPAGAGDFPIEAGKEAAFRYRFYIHSGDTEQAKVGEKYKEYAAEKVEK